MDLPVAEQVQVAQVVADPLVRRRQPQRERRIDDLADACLFLMLNYDGSEIVNIGTGRDITIRELADMVKEVIGYKEEIIWVTSKPDGTPQKLLDISRLSSLGWKPRISLREGVEMTYEWYRS